jgi:hypothetical protein
LPGIFDSKIAPGLVSELMSAAPRRVTVGAGDEWWDEYPVREDSMLGRTLAGGVVIDMINCLWGRRVEYGTRMWGQIYTAGQRIPWHTDGQGDIQLVLCLEAAPAGCGGSLLLREDGAAAELNLQSGDGLLFKATNVPHSTTPIVSMPAHENPRRVVAVARFFISDD